MCTHLQPVLSVRQLNMQLSEDIALVASVLDLHAGPSGVPPFWGLDIHIAPHTGSPLRINRIQIPVLLQKKQRIQAHSFCLCKCTGFDAVSSQVPSCKRVCAQVCDGNAH